MRNLLALAALGVLVFLGLGWYLGWYKIQREPTSDGHTKIEVEFNNDKIKQDVGKGTQKVRDLLATDPNNPQGSPVTNQPGGFTPPGTPNGTPTSFPGSTSNFQPNQDGSVVFPSFPITPPSSGPSLPPPR